MRRLAVVTVVLVVGCVVGAAVPSRAANPAVGAASASDGVFVWSASLSPAAQPLAHPQSGYLHLTGYTLSTVADRSSFGFEASSGGASIDVNITTGNGSDLTVGSSQLSVTVSGDGQSCNGQAWVTIDDIAFDSGNRPARLSAHFTAPCAGPPAGDVAISAMLNTSVAEPVENISLVGLHWGTLYKEPPLDVSAYGTISNPGAVPLSIQSVTTTSTAFFVATNCSGVTLQPNEACGFSVRPRMDGQSLGLHQARLQVADGMSSVAGHGVSTFALEATYATPPSSPFTVASPPFSFPANTQPVVGDYNGDGSDDIFWYGSGGTHDALWTSRPVRSFSVQPEQVQGDYVPLVGDFDGDGRADIFWYAPGAAIDRIWYRVGASSRFRTVQVYSRYRPVVSDFDGNGVDDVLWYAPGRAPDAIWFGNFDHTFTSRPITINGDYAYVTGGDFNGDHVTDLLFWNPNVVRHPLWLSGPPGRFTSSSLDSPGPGSIPLTMYADRSGRVDVLWYGPGSKPDAVYSSNSGGSATLAINGFYEPVWANFDGDDSHLDDIIWWSTTSNASSDPYWTSNGYGLDPHSNTAPHVDGNRYVALVGRFQAAPTFGYGQPDSTDILYMPVYAGDHPVLWWSHDIDGTSNPSPLARPRSSATTAASRAPSTVRGPGQCGPSAPDALRLVCRAG